MVRFGSPKLESESESAGPRSRNRPADQFHSALAMETSSVRSEVG